MFFGGGGGGGEEDGSDGRINDLSCAIVGHFKGQYENRVKKVVEMHRILQRVAAVDGSTDDGASSSSEKDDNESAYGKEVGQKSKRLLAFQRMIHRYLDADESSNGGCSVVADSETGKSTTDDTGDFNGEDAQTMSLFSSNVDNLLQHPSLHKHPLPSTTSPPTNSQPGL